MKIGIFGMGFVGSTITYSLCLLNLVEEIVVYDQDYKKTKANILDIQDGLHNKKLLFDKRKLSQCDAIIICVGNSLLLKEEQGRYKEKNITDKAIKDLCNQLKKDKYDGFIINVSNPNDIITNNIYKILKDKKKIFGTGTWLDTNRLKNIVNNITIIGEHGKGEIDKNYKSLLQDRYNEIIEGKGYTNFGISKIVCEIIKIIQQTIPKRVIISTYNGKNFTSRVVLLSNKGVEEIK